MADAEINFGANTDDLVKGIDGAKAAIEGIDGSVKKVADSGSSLGAILVGAFSVAAIEEFARGMGKVADEIERVSAILGTDTATTSLLSGIGKLTDTSLKDVQKALEAINDSASKATADHFSEEAQAFKQLKIDADDLTSTPIQSWFGQLADAVSRLNPSLERSAIVSKIGGDALKNMMPTLVQGGQEFERLAKIVTDSGAVMTTSQVSAFSAVKAEMTTFQLYTSGAANVIYERLTPAMMAIIDGLTHLTASFTESVKAGGPASLMLEAVAAAGRVAATAVASLVSTLEGLALAVGSIFSAIRDHSKESLDAITANMEANGKKIAADWIATLEKIWSARPPTQITVRPPGTDAEALESDLRKQARARQEALQAQIAEARGAFEQEKVIQDARVKLSQITAESGTRAVINAEQTRYESEKNLLEQEKALWGEGSLEYERVQRRIVQATQQHNTEILRLNAQLALQYKQRWDDVFGALQTSFNSQLRGLLAGTVTWSQAFKTVMGDMIIFFIQQVEKMVFQWLAGKLAMAAADKTEAATRIATETAAQTATLPARAAKFTSDITADAALVFAGIFANMAPLLGPAAAGPAAAGEATVLAQLGAIPKFELGTDFVPYTGLAIVHQGEKIIPAAQNARGGGPSTTIHISAWDAGSIAQWLSAGGASLLAKHVSKAMNSNPSLRPKY